MLGSGLTMHSIGSISRLAALLICGMGSHYAKKTLL
ncbi:hypothetical protein PSEUDO9AZ_30077 [Pseudomonas sp. 9AZ]|nr:hypothetical protein PSEUDO9AZ_30077 [Pseudomonas sp. 9AZ]